MQTGLYSLILQKATKVDILNNQNFSTGAILNLTQVDVPKFEQYLIMVFWLVYSMISLIFNLSYMYMLIGNSTIVIGGGSFSLIGAIIIVYLISSRVRKRLLTAKDKRLNFFKNVIRNLRYIKMRAWENFYAYRVYYLREKEMYYLKIIAVLSGLLYFFEWYIVSGP